MKTSEIKKLTVTQLQKELANFKKEQFNLRFQRVNSQIQNTARIKTVRRTIAKILTFINQKKKDKSPMQLNCCRNLILYEDECRIVKNGVDVELAPLEYKLIKLLMENPKVVWSRERLIEKVWGFDYAGNTKTVDVHIRWLREKIEDDPSVPKMIKTVRGFGYRFCSSIFSF